MVNLNFSGVEERTALPEGIYGFSIKAAEMKTTSTNKPMLAVQLKEDESGNIVFDNFVIQENTLWRLKSFLGKLGYDVEGELDFDEEDLVGMTISAKIAQEMYNDEPKNVVKKYL